MSKFNEVYDIHDVFVSTDRFRFRSDERIALDYDDGTSTPRFKSLETGETHYLHVHDDLHRIGTMTEFEKRGFVKDDVFVTGEYSNQGEGAIVTLDMDDNSANPRFLILQESQRCDEFYTTGTRCYITLDFLTKIGKMSGFEAGTLPNQEPQPEAAPVEESQRGNKYDRTIKTSLKDDDSTLVVDVYSVLEAFEVNNSAMAHAVKKLLAPGLRGVKSREQDIREAISSLERALRM